MKEINTPLDKDWLSNDQLVCLSDEEIVNAIIEFLWTDAFYFNSDSKLKWDFDKFEKFLFKTNYIKLFELDYAKNKNYEMPSEIKAFIDKLKISNSFRSVYSYVFNIYFPWEGVYSFYYNPAANNVDDSRIYRDLKVYLADIEKFITSRDEEEYIVSVFSSKPWGWRWPNYTDLVVANNIDYRAKKAA